MKWSFQLVRIGGIDVKVHWTFAILLFWLAINRLTSGQSIQQTAAGLAFVLAIFTCVLLHEFGHAMAARRYGIRTPDITLLPIGGVARLERIPEEPGQELFIAIAGPLVNVAISAVLFLLLLQTGGLSGWTASQSFGDDFLVSLFLINVSLAVFNLIPAFPMDGGRVLRAFLATRMNHVRATEIAAGVGQMLAIGFGIIGLFTNWFLLFIALFVYLGAEGESQAVLLRSMLSGVKVRDAMMTRFDAVAAHDPVRAVVDLLLAGDQQDFPVVEGNRVLGMLRRQELIRAVAAGNMNTPVAEIMQTDCAAVSHSGELQATFEIMQGQNCPALPVIQNGALVGLLTQANVAEWLMIQTAIRGSSGSTRPAME